MPVQSATGEGVNVSRRQWSTMLMMTPKMNKENTPMGLLFDKDGTLFDFHATWTPVFERLALVFSKNDSEQAARLLTAGGYDPPTRRYRSDSPLVAGDIAEIAALWSKLAGRSAGEVESLLEREFHAADPVPLTDLPVLMAALKDRGFLLGVATQDGEASARAGLEKAGAMKFLDFLAGYDSGHGSKPSPGMVHGFCRAVGVSPGSVAVIGDSPRDLAMARAASAGLAVGVLSGPADAADLHDADAILADVSALPAWLDGLTPA